MLGKIKVLQDMDFAMTFYDRLNLAPYERVEDRTAAWIVYRVNGQRLNSTSFLLNSREFKQLAAMLPDFLTMEGTHALG